MKFSLIKAAYGAAFFALLNIGTFVMASSNTESPLPTFEGEPSIQCTTIDDKILISLISIVDNENIQLQTNNGNTVTMVSSLGSTQNFRLGPEQLPANLVVESDQEGSNTYIITALCQINRY